MTEYRRGLEAAKQALHEATVGIDVSTHTVVSIVGVCWRSVQRLINKDDDENEPEASAGPGTGETGGGT